MNGETSPQPGDELINSDSQVIGIITYVAPDIKSNYQLLAVIQDRAVSTEKEVYYNNKKLSDLLKV